MKITAITRYKHGELYAILKRLGWSQSELARQSNMSTNTVNSIINLLKRPTRKQADAIQQALGNAGEYLDVLAEWPEVFEGLKPGYTREQTVDVPMERLLDHPEVLEIAAPEPEDDRLHKRMASVLAKFPKKEQEVIRKRFWEGKTLEQSAKEMGFSAHYIDIIQKRAVRMLGHPSRLKQLVPEMFAGSYFPNNADPNDLEVTDL